MHGQVAQGPRATGSDDLEGLDRQSVLHPFTRVSDYAAGDTPAPFFVARADGVNVFDKAGKAYIDGFSALYCVNAGYGQRRIVDAMHAQAEAMPYFHIFAGATHEPAVRLADTLLRIAGPDMKRVFFGTSGSDANETQVKLVWYANNVWGKPNKKKIIARRRGYHGGTIVTASLTGLPIYHQGFDLVSNFIRHTLAPDPFWAGGDDRALVQRCVDDLERLILEEGPDTVGGFIAEPMIGAGGAVPPPDGYWPAIQEVLARYEVLLILDEVVTGFGRVGEMLGSQVWGIKPDLVTLAKGLTSGYAPLSAVLVGDKVWQALQAGTAMHGMFGHGFTYTAHPLGAAAALANIAVFEDDELCANARTVGAHLFSSLKERFEGQPLVGQVRSVGLFGAVEFVAESEPLRHLAPELKFAARVSAMARAQGLLVRTMPYGDIAGLAPPLILTTAEADAIVDRLERAYEATLAELTPSQRRGEAA